MPADATHQHHESPVTADERTASLGGAPISRIAVGVDGYPEGEDAVALGAAIARVTDAELMLVAVQPQPLVVLPHEMDWTSLRALSRTALSQARDALAPDARTTIETDHSVARALQRVVEREHRDLLVVGSSRQAADGTVRIGKRTRQLLCHFCSALAIAPRGLRTQPDLSLARIGVGYDASPESGAALALGAAIAAAAGGDLQVRSVVDDRMPGLGWDSIWTGDMMADWRQIVQREMDALRDRAIVATRAAGVTADVEAVAGRPADVLAALSREVDLLVIGSRRWGPVARLLLGSTGEALLHNAASPVIAVPRPAG